jgi:chloramphenicol-sensitive protein RarD|tara:strand:- start:1678 stop:2550 length:873 start_codon:yes stop_codon:yes gene_type:complete
MSSFNKGIIYIIIGSFWWGVIGVIYFRSVSFVGSIELVLHRVVWTAAMLIITTLFMSKWTKLKKIFKNKKKLTYLTITGFLIFINWSVWIYAVSTNQIVDASFGYFIMPIISVLFGYLFFKEILNKLRIFSVILTCISVLYLFYFYKNFPWIGLTVGFSWALYNVFRKKINVDVDLGLLIESLVILPFALIGFYLVYKSGHMDFGMSSIKLSFILTIAGPMTVIPLFFFVKGVHLSGLGPSGMLFFITPTFQFILGLFLYNEPFDTYRLIGFILIWVAVIIYLFDLYEKN